MGALAFRAERGGRGQVSTSHYLATGGLLQLWRERCLLTEVMNLCPPRHDAGLGSDPKHGVGAGIPAPCRLPGQIANGSGSFRPHAAEWDGQHGQMKCFALIAHCLQLEGVRNSELCIPRQCSAHWSLIRKRRA